MARNGTGPACWPAHGVACAWFAWGGRAVCGRNTPLHDAANAQQYDVVRLLVANGADVAAANEDGCVPRGMPCRVVYHVVWDSGTSLGTLPTRRSCSTPRCARCGSVVF